MTLLTILLAVLAILAIVSIILGVMNWVQLSSSSSRVAYLETEVDKKTREFDAIKKEHASSGDAPASVLHGSGSDSDTVVSNSTGESTDDIEIVRNVRSGIDSPDQSHLSRETKSLSRETIARYTAEANAESQYPAQQQYAPYDPTQQPALPAYHDGGATAAASPATDEQAQAWDLALPSLGPSPFGNTGQTGEELPQAYGQTLNITLFSPAANAADFSGAWQTMMQSLPYMQQPQVVLDMTGVVYLYDTELGYLEQFLQTVQSYGGYLYLTNCRVEVTALLGTRPQLAPLIR